MNERTSPKSMQYFFTVLILIVLTFSTSLASELPNSFMSREEAANAGCKFVNVKGPGHDTCVLTFFEENQMNLWVYERAQDSTYKRSNAMIISSWYWGAELSFVDFLQSGTDWLVIKTEGMRGTGISQQILLIIGWDGKSFRTLVNETLNYTCYLTTVQPSFQLKVNYSFQKFKDIFSIRFEYDFGKNEQTVAKWNDVLRWDAAKFTFVPSTTDTQRMDPMAKLVQDEIAVVRNNNLEHSLDPEEDLFPGEELNGVMNALIPVCDLH